MSGIINMIRQNVPNWSKEKWTYAEAVIEKLDSIQRNETANKDNGEKKTKKRGRPKKKEDTKEGQKKMEDFFMEED